MIYPRSYSLLAVSVRSKLLQVERPSLVFRSHVSVGCNATAEADHRVYDVMVWIRPWLEAEAGDEP